MDQEATLEELIALLREFHCGYKCKITATTLLEDDLGISGDDGHDLVEQVERRFNVSFVGKDGTFREAFDLGKDEYLFHGEGFRCAELMLGLLGIRLYKVKPLTVGQLLEAILRCKKQDGNRRDSCNC